MYDVEDFKKRLFANLPNSNAVDSWFGEVHPNLDALLTGFATLDTYIHGFAAWVKEQMRIQTAEGPNLDLFACDYFAGDVTRVFGLTTDDAFRRYILATLLQEEATRNGMYNAVLNLTGYPPIIIEWGSGDTSAAWNIPIWGLNTAGGFGSGAPYNFWITVFADSVEETKHAGFNSVDMGYDIFGSGAKGGLLGEGGDNNGGLTDSQIIELINRVKVYGTVANITIIRL